MNLNHYCSSRFGQEDKENICILISQYAINQGKDMPCIYLDCTEKNCPIKNSEEQKTLEDKFFKL